MGGQYLLAISSLNTNLFIILAQNSLFWDIVIKICCSYIVVEIRVNQSFVVKVWSSYFVLFIRLIPRVNNNHWFNTHQYFGDKYMLVTYWKNVHWFIIILKTAYFGRFLSWFGGSTKFLNNIWPKGDWGSLGWYITMVWYHF